MLRHERSDVGPAVPDVVGVCAHYDQARILEKDRIISIVSGVELITATTRELAGRSMICHLGRIVQPVSGGSAVRQRHSSSKWQLASAYANPPIAARVPSRFSWAGEPGVRSHDVRRL